MKAKILLILNLLFSASLFAQTRVGFVELKNWQGKVIQLEPDFAYAHVAIQTDWGWIHAHPKNGVEWTTLDALNEWGSVKIVFETQSQLQMGYKQLSAMVGKAYDNEFSWDDLRFYCSELVAKLLGISPRPMHFDLKFWPPFYQKYEGLPGIAPSHIFDWLKEKGASPVVELAPPNSIH